MARGLQSAGRLASEYANVASFTGVIDGLHGAGSACPVRVRHGRRLSTKRAGTEPVPREPDLAAEFSDKAFRARHRVPAIDPLAKYRIERISQFFIMCCCSVPRSFVTLWCSSYHLCRVLQCCVNKCYVICVSNQIKRGSASNNGRSRSEPHDPRVRSRAR